MLEVHESLRETCTQLLRRSLMVQDLPRSQAVQCFHKRFGSHLRFLLLFASMGERGTNCGFRLCWFDPGACPDDGLSGGNGSCDGSWAVFAISSFRCARSFFNCAFFDLSFATS
eukprot:gnl/TRDRNA2_/TRDRNA2_166304_c0_seq2.p1 gnl/TRDRNA2_/TRDRNA2_166304_c0~~gnl/TRDRNA2_/TRDRNA2_166304_c0_seq2.p1  ORF type:complete len:114 (+),score=7.83 gnl/TRDRNA2_/TRDRNA2_166304_c0_seq2:349-690(+)